METGLYRRYVGIYLHLSSFSTPPFIHFCWGIYEELEMYTGGGERGSGSATTCLE